MYGNRKVWVVIPASGSGTRMGLPVNKLLLEISGKAMIEWSVEAFQNHPWVDGIVVVTGDERIAELAKGHDKVLHVVRGGDSRSQSVRSGLDRISDAHALVLVHDGARPGVTGSLITAVIRAADETGAAIPALPVTDTVKRAAGDRVVETLKRDELVRVQTPQGFDLALLQRAFKEISADVTDEAMLVEQMGHPVSLVPGDVKNEKVTVAEDWHRMRGGNDGMRIGTGYDVHRLVEDRPLVLGGVTIPHVKGLLGHSDADVLLHAIMDALLGAVAAGDIGQHFPDTDPAYQGSSSLKLLEKARWILAEKGYSARNVDATVMAQAPKLAPHIEAMRSLIAEALEIPVDAVSIKATTTEGLGFVGREEGIAAQAVVTVDKQRGFLYDEDDYLKSDDQEQ